MLDPIIYANVLARKMKQSGAEAWLVNTGWVSGPYGTGHRIDLPTTRKIINAILDGSLNNSNFTKLPVFNLNIPDKVEGVESSILDPANGWESRLKWNIAATDLGLKFINNFSKFTTNPETAALADHGPTIV